MYCYLSVGTAFHLSKFRLLYFFCCLVSGPDPQIQYIALGPDRSYSLRGEEVLRFTVPTLVLYCTLYCTRYLLVFIDQHYRS